MKTLKIQVTQEDIDDGIQDDPGNCPIALALRTAGAIEVSVGVAGIITVDGVQYEMTPGVCEFIYEFDSEGVGDVPKPQAFEIHERQQ